MPQLLPSQLASGPRSDNGKSCSTAMLATAAVATVAVAAVLYRWREPRHGSNQQNHKQHEQEAAAQQPTVPEGYVTVQLTNWDNHLLKLPATTTTTFFRFVKNGPPEGIYSVRWVLRKRMRAMIKANPWLAGTLQRDENGSLTLVHPPAHAITDDLCDSFMHMAPEGLRINVSMSASDTRAAIENYVTLPPAGPAAVGQTLAEAPLVCLAVAPCMQENGSPATKAADFVVVFVLSHVAGGVPTYYRLYGMLSGQQFIESLTAERVDSCWGTMRKILGHDVRSWLSSSAKKMNSQYCSLFHPAAKLHHFLVDHEKVAALKAEATSKPESEGAFASTNDVLCSCYGQMVGASLLIMPMDLRGKLYGVAENLAGNYEHQMALNDNVCASASGVRALLTAVRSEMKAATSGTNSDCGSSGSGGVKSSSASVQRFTKPLPSVWSFMKDRYAIMTNWASVHKDLALPGCEEVLHANAADLELLKRVLLHDFAVVYRVWPGQLALYTVSKLFKEEDFLRCMPLKRFEGLPT